MSSERPIKFIVALFIVGVLSIECDRVKEPFVEVQEAVDTTWNPIFPERTNPIKKVLLEDFTGHQCGNCPRAHEEAQNILNLYPNKIVLLSEHVGYFAEVRISGKYTYDFRTQVGNEIDNEFGASAAGLPKGMINRLTYNNSKIHDKNTWNTLVNQALQSTLQADIQILYKWTNNQEKLNVAVQARKLENLSNNLKLFVYLVEDSIINWQKDYSKNPQDIPDYVHRHVLRGSFNGTWGDNVLWDNNLLFEKKYALNINPSYNKQKLYVIAGLYDFNTKEIIQVEEIKVQ